MSTVLTIDSVSKVYSNGFKALDDITLSISKGEIFALLGPNGAGKTTLISTICGIMRQSKGKVSIKGFDSIRHWRETRKIIGLVPQAFGPFFYG